MHIERYCTCGAVLKVNVAARKKAQALAVWFSAHSGPGHEEATAAQAEAARMGTATGMGRESARQEARRR